MAIRATIIDIDEFYRMSPNEPIVVNRFNVRSEQDKEEINRLIMTQYGSDFLEVEPSCHCMATKGGRFIGVVCPICSTKVVSVTERQLETSVWLEVPQGVAAFIHPKVYSILSEYLTISRFNILEHLVNPSAPPPETKTAVVLRYMRLNIPRGINYFHDNFEAVLQQLMDEGILRKDPEDKVDGTGRLSSLMAFLTTYREMIFCQHLPLPTKLLMITERTPMTTFAAGNMLPALEAVRIISGMENDQRPLTPKSLQSKAMKANALMAEYSEKNFAEFFDQKSGWIRQHVFGARSHFTGRAVINSLHEPHDYEELHLPWALSVMLFRVHLVSKLMRRHWTLREAQTLLDENTLRYHPILDELFQEMIADAPGGRIPVLLNRNPSLVRGSIQQLFITKIKTDTEVKSISVSALVLRNFNSKLVAEYSVE